MLFWASAVLSSIDAHRRGSRASRETAAASQQHGSTALGEHGADDGAGDGVRLPARPERKLLSIGYLVAEGALDPNCYDLLASEARLASFFAIAKGDVPATHWFRLGRAATPVATAPR